jgi:hypothetical protein
LFKELLNFKTKTIPLPLPNRVVNIGQDAQDMQIIHYGLCFLEIFDFDLLSQNGRSKVALFCHQNL